MKGADHLRARLAAKGDNFDCILPHSHRALPGVATHGALLSKGIGAPLKSAPANVGSVEPAGPVNRLDHLIGAFARLA